MGEGSLMSIKKQFECESCNAIGVITIRGEEFTSQEIVYCPLCSADIYEEEEDFDEE